MAASKPDTGPNPDYDPHVWHDDTIYGLRFCTPDLISPHEAADDWTSALILDIDHIVAWVRAEHGIRFHIAPADLIFLDANDLEMAIDWGDSGGQTGVHEPSIDFIAREPVAGAGQVPPLYRWRVALNHPAGGEIAFHARRFELKLRCPPVLRDEQRQPVSDRD